MILILISIVSILVSILKYHESAWLTIRIQVLVNIRRLGRHLSSYLSSYLMNFCKIRLILNIMIWWREDNNIVKIQIIVKTSKMSNKKKMMQISYYYSTNIIIAHNYYNENCQYIVSLFSLLFIADWIWWFCSHRL